MKKFMFAFISAVTFLMNLSSIGYAYNYINDRAEITQNSNPNLYERAQPSGNSYTGGYQTNNPNSGYRSSYYYQDNYYRYNSNPNNVYPDNNYATPNYSGTSVPNANSPYRGDYQGGYEYRTPY
jgi:hypothetical protein